MALPITSAYLAPPVCSTDNNPPADPTTQCSDQLVTVHNTAVTLSSASPVYVYRYDERPPHQIMKTGFSGNNDKHGSCFQAFGTRTVFTSGKLEGVSNFREYSQQQKKKTLYLYAINVSSFKALDFEASYRTDPTGLCKAIHHQQHHRQPEALLTPVSSHAKYTYQADIEPKIKQSEIQIQGPIPPERITHIGTNKMLHPGSIYNTTPSPVALYSTYRRKIEEAMARKTD